MEENRKRINDAMAQLTDAETELSAAYYFLNSVIEDISETLSDSPFVKAEQIKYFNVLSHINGMIGSIESTVTGADKLLEEVFASMKEG